jgi:Na+/melibiose symporter-like transporter
MPEEINSDAKTQKNSLIDQIWQISNIVTGYCVAQAFVILLTLCSENEKNLLKDWAHVTVGIIGICAVILILITTFYKQEIKLRKELNADETILKIVKEAHNLRMWLIIGTHLLASMAIVLLHFHEIH